MNKGELMKLVYGSTSNIDSAIPSAYWNKLNTRIHVMNYRGLGLGEIQNLYKQAIKKGLQIDYSEEYAKCVESDEYFYNNYCWQEGMEFYTPDVFEKYITGIRDIRDQDFKDQAEDMFKAYPIKPQDAND